MIVTATTLKDDLTSVRRFVAGNTAGGVDHLMVFLDADQPEVAAWLGEHPHVTCIRTDTSWWAGERPAKLNERQRLNANVAKAVCAALGGVDWVFHIDADEVAQIDRAELAGVPAEAAAVRLTPMEVVSESAPAGEPRWFKRLASDDELTLLHTLGVIDRPHNGAYFHGHVDGKVGMRPGLEPWLALHQVVDADRNPLDAVTGAGLQVLHYESWSGEEFVRKWTALLEAGPMANFRAGREPTAIALRTLIGRGLDPDTTRKYLLRIFERTTADDLATLRDLGLAVEVDPASGTHRPESLTADAAARLGDLIERARSAPKKHFRPGGDTGAVAAALGLAAPVSRGRRFARRS
ncbi:glycosyltransferase family 2 protein [Nocardioides limicola]|uniref:glycosyltransferase family 2 protein n=1 Tax=Nocardioides limicola TaxID=2803368 RepID=UPI00193B75D1|nr:glycosyltransferase family 2 protein [Nocardioides sp. DJM-14]